MTRPSNDPSLTNLARQLPNVAKSPLGKAAIWVLMAAFACLVAGGVSFGAHLPALGIVFSVLTGISLVALFGIGLAATVMFVLRPVRRSNAARDDAAFTREHPDK
jgi:predicted RND superfamily exporter protein